MSLNKLYQEIPLEERLCEGCGNTIQRNIAMLDGKIYHYGCLKQSKTQPSYQCLNCWSYLTGKGLVKVAIESITKSACGNCGSTNLRFLQQWKKQTEKET